MAMHVKMGASGPVAYSLADLRRDNPNTSFPAQPSDAALAALGVYPCAEPPKPTCDPRTHEVICASFTQEASVWTAVWAVVELDAAAENVRAARNDLLGASDWTQVADAPVDKAAWGTYRQTLRDIPEQAGFPFSVVWPSKPE